MMRFLRTALTVLGVVALSAGMAFAQDQTAAQTQQDEIVLAQAKKRTTRTVRNTGTHVYLLRGWLDVFSTGMDDLGVKLNRSGIRASVHGHAEYYSIADAIGERYRQGTRENVVIIGHSLGANAAFQMADRLGDYGVTVPLIITYDPTASMSVGKNVSRVVNFYSSTNGWGAPIVRGAGFRGNLSNVDLSRRGEMGHTDIDKSPALHSQSINYIRSIGGSRSTSATARPKKDEEQSKKADDSKSASAKEGDGETAEKKTADKKTDGADAKAVSDKGGDPKVVDEKTADKKPEDAKAVSDKGGEQAVAGEKTADKKADDTKAAASAATPNDAAKKPDGGSTAAAAADSAKAKPAADDAPASTGSATAQPRVIDASATTPVKPAAGADASAKESSTAPAAKSAASASAATSSGTASAPHN